MCNVDQQKEALRNVAYGADATWASDLCPFQRANMGLYLAARRVKAKTSKWAQLTPRTVRDCIPQSRLAQYSNYEYDDARELSYSPVAVKFERLYESFDGDSVSEPWMLEEIDDLFIGFISYCEDNSKACSDNHYHETLCCPNKEFCEMSFESPFLDASNFDQMALKLKIVAQNIKKIWDAKYFPYYGWHPVAKAKNLVLFKSPACQMFTSVKEEIEDSDWLKEVSDPDSNIAQIKTLAKGFKEQNTWIFKKQSSRSWLESHHDSADLSSHKRLYSAVLQGASPNQLHQPPDRNPIASFQFPPVKNRGSAKRSETGTETTESAACHVSTCAPSVAESNNNRRVADVGTLGFHTQQGGGGGYPPYYAAASSRSTVQTTPSTTTPIATSVFATPPSYASYHQQYFPHHQTNPFLGPRLYANNFIPNTSVLNFRQTNYFPLVLQNAAAAAAAPYAQSPFFNYQRGTFPSYRTMVFPQRPQVVVPSSGWFLQAPVKIGQPPAVNLVAARPPVHAPSYHYRSPRPRLARPSPCESSLTQSKEDDAVNQDMDNIVAKTVSAVLDDSDPYVPVTGVPSDELELQALEQYSYSSTNVFQELERQAAEQYETSENWRSPPKCHDRGVTFGGYLNVKLVRFRCVMGRVLGLGCSSNTIKAEVPINVLAFGK